MFIISTYEGGHPPADAAWFCQWLDDMATDFRVGNAALTTARMAVFGCGSSVYGSNFNAVARRVEKQLRVLGAERLAPLGLGDDAASDMAAQFEAWASTVLHAARTGTTVDDAASPDGQVGERGQGAVEVDGVDEEDGSEEENGVLEGGAAETSVDIEDLAGPSQGNLPADTVLGDKEMLNAVQRASLTKQVENRCSGSGVY